EPQEAGRVHPRREARRGHRRLHRRSADPHHAAGRAVPDVRRPAADCRPEHAQHAVRVRRHGAAHRRRGSARYGATGAAAPAAPPVRRLHEGWRPRRRHLARSLPTLSASTLVFILILGAPGSGKGTQGKILADRLGLPKITTGDLIRAAMKDGTPFGLDARKYYDDGKLVPDGIILGMIKEQLDRPEAKTGAILDGFPRTAAQAELVDRTLAASGQRLNHILLLDVTEDELVRRMSARSQVEGRSDDAPEAIANRLQIYQRDTAPLIAHYTQRGIVHRVPGTGTVDKIAGEIKRIIGR